VWILAPRLPDPGGTARSDDGEPLAPFRGHARRVANSASGKECLALELHDTTGPLKGRSEDWLMVESDFDEFVRQFQQALGRFFDGDPEPCKRLMSHGEDVTLANPFGPIARGWSEVDAAMDRTAANYRDGAATAFETATRHVTPELAYTVWVERFTTTIGDGSISSALRRTTVYRPESGSWRVVHTHADPITTPRSAESLIPH
jgi:ketosteroid isomerase-like protein